MLLLSSSVSGGVVLALLALIAVAYGLGAYPLYRIAKATSDRVDEASWAWVPVLNIILVCRIAGVSSWTVLLLLVSWIPLFGALTILAYTLILWVKIGQRFNRPGLGVVAWILPILGAWLLAYRITPEHA
jgi:Family of unknown function (DUF5684)